MAALRKMIQAFDELLFCYTGEPRSLMKGMRIRDATLRRHVDKKVDIKTNYLINVADGLSSKAIKRLVRATALVGQDRYLSGLQLGKKESRNMYKYIIEQKLDILQQLASSHKVGKRVVIILTRPDWNFDRESVQLAARAAITNKIIIPQNRSKISVHNSTKFKAICDQFMTIPQDKLGAVITALKTGLTIAEEQAKPAVPVVKDIMLGGDGRNRYGIGPEAILGLGFCTSLGETDYEEVEFNYKYGPGTYDACSHNLIRDDAAKWMDLNPIEIWSKKQLFLKGKLLGMREKLISRIMAD